MKRNFLILLLLLSISTLQLLAQKISAEEYIATWKDKAIEEMQKYGIPASITLAQGLLESGNGNSLLATVANNHFGIKCHKEWMGETFHQDDDEKNECFRKYQNAGESFDDHSDFLKTRSRYTFLFDFDKTDYVSWANGLKQAGYATNPKYPELLINLIDKYNLHQYDFMDKPLLAKENKKEVKEEQTKPNRRTAHQKEQEIERAPQITPYQGDIFILNNIKTVEIKEGDSPLKIASQYGVSLNRLYKYNDMAFGDELQTGQYMFLQPKRKKGSEKTHKVRVGESMYDISQMYGVKMMELYDKNKMLYNAQPLPGELIYLRGERENPPKTRSYDAMIKEKQAIDNEAKKEAEAQEAQEEKKRKVYDELKNEKQQVDVNVNIKIEQPLSTAGNNQTVTYQNEVQPKAETAIEPPVIASPEIAQKSDSQNVSNSTEPQIVPSDGSVYYEVKQGDTMYSISRMFSIKVADIQSMNNMVGFDIKVGQLLKVGNK